MFTVTVQTSFTAEHQLTLATGEVEALHEHNWVVYSAVTAENLDKAGLVIDFHWLKATIEEVTSPLGGTRLEELTFFRDINASAENVAKYIYDQVEPLLPARVQLEYVEVCEAANCLAKYSR
ncbi:MAG: 6-pyruvoyl trahydropterin synthase family protein [Planctomycetota bacterium]